MMRGQVPQIFFPRTATAYTGVHVSGLTDIWSNLIAVAAVAAGDVTDN